MTVPSWLVTARADGQFLARIILSDLGSEIQLAAVMVCDLLLSTTVTVAGLLTWIVAFRLGTYKEHIL